MKVYKSNVFRMEKFFKSLVIKHGCQSLPSTTFLREGQKKCASPGVKNAVSLH